MVYQKLCHAYKSVLESDFLQTVDIYSWIDAIQILLIKVFFSSGLSDFIKNALILTLVLRFVGQDTHPSFRLLHNAFSGYSIYIFLGRSFDETQCRSFYKEQQFRIAAGFGVSVWSHSST